MDMEILPMCISKPAGYVYIAKIDPDRFDNWYRIGITKNVDGRMRTYKGQYNWVILISYGYTHNMRGVEKRLHNIFNYDRPPHSCGWGIEFFQLNESKLNSAIKALDLFCQASFTYD
jgi:hypothetical protein